MKLTSEQVTLGVIGAVVVLGVVISQFFAPTYDPLDATYNVAYWDSYIQLHGGVRTYEAFTARSMEEDVDRQHLSAHVMGELLFKHMGTEGITVCDTNFGFGCYHGFFGRAISEGGVESIRTLDQACVDAFGPLGTGCQHGIGHGILEYVGYDSIEKALTLCKETTQVVPLLGCTSGVFMEYHTPLAGLSDALVPRARVLNPARPYEPCDAVSEGYRASCFYELGLWLTSSEEDAQDAGQVCGGLTEENRTHCYMGIGVGFAHHTGYAVQKGIELCEVFREADTLSCRAGLAWGMYMIPAHRLYMKDACGYTDVEARETCEARADFTQGRDSQFTQ